MIKNNDIENDSDKITILKTIMINNDIENNNDIKRY
jgi:hypothetical protein